MIRKFEIYNYKFKETEGYLFYNTETDEYSMKLLEDYTGKHPDIFFKILHDQGVVDVPEYLVDVWVQDRVIPPNRQGLEGLLKERGMTEYHIFDLLMYAMGRCQLDYSTLVEIKYEGDYCTQYKIKNFNIKKKMKSDPCLKISNMGDGYYLVCSKDRTCIAEQVIKDIIIVCNQSDLDYWVSYFY